MTPIEEIRSIIEAYKVGSRYTACIDHILYDTRFAQGYGSSVDTSHKHHAYPGGLAVHTLEVLKNACGLASTGTYNHQILLPELITATIYHDYFKIKDYDEAGHKTSHSKNIYHLAGSYGEWYRVSSIVGVPPVERELIGHCILAHHGRKEWGSPIEPQCAEAQILHFADYLSMQYGAGR